MVRAKKTLSLPNSNARLIKTIANAMTIDKISVSVTNNAQVRMPKTSSSLVWSVKLIATKSKRSHNAKKLEWILANATWNVKERLQRLQLSTLSSASWHKMVAMTLKLANKKELILESATKFAMVNLKKKLRLANSNACRRNINKWVETMANWCLFFDISII